MVWQSLNTLGIFEQFLQRICCMIISKLLKNRSLFPIYLWWCPYSYSDHLTPSHWHVWRKLLVFYGIYNSTRDSLIRLKKSPLLLLSGGLLNIIVQRRRKIVQSFDSIMERYLDFLRLHNLDICFLMLAS